MLDALVVGRLPGRPDRCSSGGVAHALLRAASTLVSTLPWLHRDDQRYSSARLFSMESAIRFHSRSSLRCCGAGATVRTAIGLEDRRAASGEQRSYEDSWEGVSKHLASTQCPL